MKPNITFQFQLKIVNMKYIITEDQADNLFFRRRGIEIADLFRNQYAYSNPCDYDNLEHFLYSLRTDMFEELEQYDWMKNMNDKVLWGMIMEMYGEEIINWYNESCGPNRYKFRRD